MIEGIDHIAIAVENLDESLTLFESVFGMKAHHREVVADQNVEVATIQTGNTAIELVAPTSNESGIATFLAKRGPGIHHIALQVTDIVSALATLKEKGAELIDASPRTGKEDSKVAFVHPRSTGRVLFELVEPANDSANDDTNV
jgi:methylmalonyl-CoA/ethylmalonyl-CoA epimerase